MVIDYINGLDEFDGCLWFVDGNYVGHDDQIDPIHHYANENEETTFVVRHRTLRDDLTFEEIDYVMESRDLDELEPYLVPMR